jgi:hypothetical protein
MLMAMHKHAFAARNAAPFIYLFGHRMRVHRPEHNRCITARGVAGATRRSPKTALPALEEGRARSGRRAFAERRQRLALFI